MLRAGQGRVERGCRVEPGRVGWAFAVGSVLCAGLVGGLVSPVVAAEPPDGGASDVQLGSFALGDALEGTIDELDGAFGFGLSAGGLQVAWNSRAAGVDAVGLGGGWSFGLATVRVDGGVWVYPASGGAFAMNTSVPSGLSGYQGSDVVFAGAEPGAVVPARADGAVGETAYAYVLHEPGGVSTFFDAAGFPVAKLVEGGDRVDWRWQAGGDGRLEAVVGADGSVTALDWSDPSRVVIAPGSTVTEPAEGSGAGGVWQVELDGGRVSALVDPAGLRTTVRYDGAGLVERVSTPAGASTAVQWRASLDGVARVDRVRLVDEATGAELSVREWAAEGQVSPSGWPVVSDASSGGGGAVPGDPALAYATSLSDGKTRVESAVDGERRLTARGVAVTSSSGERVVREQTFEYPAVDPGAGAGVTGTRPTSVTTTHLDASGGSRVESETYTFDALGRMLSRTTTDGATTQRTYDEVTGPGRPVPIGLVTEERTTGADGLLTVSKAELSEDRASVVATETWSGREGGELTRTARVESDVEHGFVTERRVYPGGDPAAAPVVTRWSQELDARRGTKTVVQTDAAGSAAESSVSSVASLVHGGVLSKTDAVGNVTTVAYDESGRQVSATDSTGRTVSREYRTKQADGVNAVTVTGADGVVVTETRDVLGRVVRKADNIAPSGQVETGYERVFEAREFDGPGVERVTDAWGASTTTVQDVFGRVQRVTLPNGSVQVAEFDDVAGSATSGVSLTGALADAEATTTHTTDAAARSTTSTGTRADGVEVPESKTVTDGLGREVWASDGRLTTSTAYDVFGNAVETEVAPAEAAEAGAGDGTGVGAVTAEREYDAFGASVEKTLRSGEDSHAGQRRELDELGRVVAQTDQRGVTERFSYTPDGLVAEVVSGTGRVESFTYDPTSRALVGSRVSSPHGAAVETAYRHDAAGRLIAVFDPRDEAGTLISYEHDDFGNVTRTVYPDGTELRNEFDAHGRKVASVDAAGNRTEFAYDEAGALTAAVQTDRDSARLGSVRYRYDGYGRVSSLERGNGVRTEYTFTSSSQIASEVTTGPAGVLSEREYTYSADDTLTTRVDRVADEAGQLQATRTDYEYDAFERLLRSSVREGEAADGRVTTRTEYVPTVGRDLASETVITNPDTPEAVSVTRTFEYSEVGELLAIVTGDQRSTQTFDADGSLTESAAGERFEYDAAARPVVQTTADGVRIETRYWADGTRRERATGSGATRFYWDGPRLVNDVHETTDGASGVASYLIGTSRQARSIQPEGGAASTAYSGTDRHGNVTDLTDEGGVVTTRYAYRDYGQVTVTGDRSEPLPGGVGELGYNPFQYAGEYTFRDGTQSLGPRTYDPRQARFMTEDDAQLANLYAYADLNPITNVDPTGRTSANDWGQIGAALGGFALAAFGAWALVTSGGGWLSFTGILSGMLAGSDLTIAGFQLAKVFGQVQWIDDKAIEIASYSVAAASVVAAVGGGIVKGLRSVDDGGEVIFEGGGSQVKNLDGGGLPSGGGASGGGAPAGTPHVVPPEEQLDDVLRKLRTRVASFRKFDEDAILSEVGEINEQAISDYVHSMSAQVRLVKSYSDDYGQYVQLGFDKSDLPAEQKLDIFTAIANGLDERLDFLLKDLDGLESALTKLDENSPVLTAGKLEFGVFAREIQVVNDQRAYIREAIDPNRLWNDVT